MDAALLAQAETLLDLDRDAQARDVVSRLLADDPDDPRALCVLARALLGTGDPQGAARAAAAAARNAPADEWPLRLGAIAAARLGDHAAARDLATRAVHVDPDDWRTHYVFAQVGLPVRAADCEPAARTAVRLDPTNPDCHELLGDVLLDRGRTGEAEAAYREALALDPDHAGARHGLALVHARRRNLGRAAAGFAVAAAADPTDSQAAHNLVVIGARALQIVHLIMWVVLVTAERWALNTRDRLPAVIGFLVTAAAIAGFALVLWRGARPDTWRLTTLVLRRDRLLAAWSGLLVATLVLYAAAAVVPPSAEAVVIGASTVTLLVGVVVSWARLRSGRRR